MPNEASKAVHRLQGLMVGRGIDIGCGNDPVPGADKWDREQGDAQYMAGVADDTYDWVFSAHCLEHIKDPHVALHHWWRILRIGGYLMVLVPDEDLYEQGRWPSVYNADHKHTFTCGKYRSWSPASINVTDMLQILPGHRLISLTLEDTGFVYGAKGDQTQNGAEAAVQFIVKKEAYPVKYCDLTINGIS